MLDSKTFRFSRFEAFYRCWDSLRKVMIVVLFSIIISMCFVEVLLRYLPWFKSLGWTEEVLRYLNVWIIFLGASIATKRGTHLTIQYFQRFVKEEYRILLIRAIHLGILIFLAVFIVFSMKKTIQNIEQQIQAFPLTMAWFYLAMPAGALYMFVDYLLILLFLKHPFPDAEDQE